MVKIKIAHIYPKLLESFKEGYSLKKFRSDLIAGLTVGIVAVPLASAFAIASGLTPERGFFTAIIAGFFISMLGGSRYQIGGPTGAFVVVVYGIVMKVGYDGLVLATILAGVFLILFAYTRMGSYIKFIPYSVVVGFTGGIAIILWMTELKDFLGLQMGSVPAGFFDKCSAYAASINTMSPWTLGMSLLTISLILFVRKKIRRIPSHVFAIFTVTFIVFIFNIPVETIGTRFGELPRSLPVPSLPSFSFEMLNMVLPAALTIAILAGVESLLSAVVADSMTGDRHDSDTELFGQGVGNVMSSIFGGIPATGAIARTVTNIKAGAKTPVAGMIHAVTLLLFIMFFTRIIEQIPMAAIAGMLTVVAWDMFDFKRVISFTKAGRSDLFVMLTALLLTVLIDITVAVEVSVVMAALMFMKRMSDVTTLNPVNADTSSRHEDPDDIIYKIVPEGVSIYEINGPFFFGAANKLLHTLESIAKMPGIIILRMRRVPVMDATGLNALETFVNHCKHSGSVLVLSGVQPQPYKLMKKSGLVDIIGEKNITNHINKALVRTTEIIQEKENNTTK